MPDYLPHATNFEGMEKYSPSKSKPYECPKCHGYGGWNLTSSGSFQMDCNQCWGWGYVNDEDKDCIHSYKEISREECEKRDLPHHGMCWHVVECTKCGRIRAYDSSG